MSNKQRNQTAAAYGRPMAGTPGQPAIQIPQTSPRVEKETVTKATNEPVPLQIGILLLVVWLTLAFLLAWFGGEMANFKTPGRLFAFGVLATLAAIPTMLIISGDGSALHESWQNARTDRKWADVESEKVEALREVAVIDATARKELQEQQHIEKVLAIETDQQLQLGYINDDREFPMADTFVANNPQVMKNAIRKYVKRCYTADGFNREYINGPAGGLIRAPWNNEWGKELWKEQAKAYMLKYVLDGVGNGDNPSQFKLRYDNDNDAQSAMPRHQ